MKALKINQTPPKLGGVGIEEKGQFETTRCKSLLLTFDFIKCSIENAKYDCFFDR